MEGSPRSRAPRYRGLIDDPGFVASSRLHAGRRSWRCCTSARGRPPGRGRRRRVAARDPVGVRVDAGPPALPSWYGAGRRSPAGSTVPPTCEMLRRLYRDWPFFRGLVEAVEMSLVKSSTPVAAAYLARAAGAGSRAAVAAHPRRVRPRRRRGADGDALGRLLDRLRRCSGRSSGATRSSTRSTPPRWHCCAAARPGADEEAHEAVRGPLARRSPASPPGSATRAEAARLAGKCDHLTLDGGDTGAAADHRAAGAVGDQHDAPDLAADGELGAAIPTCRARARARRS